MKRIGIGIDFGTTNTVAATFDGTNLDVTSLERDNIAMPSATYVSKSYEVLIGNQAVKRYVTDNVGRKIELVPELVGKASLAVGPGDSRGGPQVHSEWVYSEPRIDRGLQGRLFRGVKRLLGRQDVKRLVVFDRLFRPTALVTPVIHRVREFLSDQGMPVASCYAGRPVHFEGKQPFCDTVGLTRLKESFQYAGFKDHQVVEEPIAAAISFVHENPSTKHDFVLTADFGGGTLDFSVFSRSSRGTYQVLATHGLPIGGDHIDQHLYRKLLFPLLGEGENWFRKGQSRDISMRFPFDDYADLLLNWGITYLLNQNRYTTPIFECIEQGTIESRAKFRRLLGIIQFNRSYDMFRLLRDLKIKLSSTSKAILDIPELDIELTLTRDYFESILRSYLEKIDAGIHETIRKAQLVNSDISIVLRTGGSSLIPAFRNLLEKRFPGRVVEHDPFRSVAAGLAIAHYFEYEPMAGKFHDAS